MKRVHLGMKSMDASSDKVLLSGSNNDKYIYLVLILSPLLALLLAIINFREKISREIIFLVIVLYGLTMNFFGDGIGEAMKFTQWYYLSFDDLILYFKEL